MALRFEVLGFAGAAPLQGACSSYLVAGERGAVLLDCGPGTLERLWRRELLRALDAVVISHMHADHVLDLVPLSGEVTQRLRDGRPPLALHVPAGDGPRTLAALDAVFGDRDRFTRAFTINAYTSTDAITVGDLTLTFAPTAHTGRCFATRVTDGRATVVYGADGAPSAAVEILAADADLLVLEATFVDDVDLATAHGHMTALEAGTLASDARARRLLLTHQLAGTSEQDLVAAAARSFSGPIRLAHERYRIEL
jgi:ribonuclease BN (tRNA processing enzyme)